MFHFQTTVTDWPRAVAKLPAGAVVKAVDRGDILRDAKAANPGVKTVLRHWYDPQQVFGGTLEENRQRARAFFATFIDGTFLSQYAPFVDYVEEWNEYNASSHTPVEIAVRVTWARAVAEVWSEMRQADSRLAHIRLVLGNIAIGNDLPRAYAELALQHDAVLGYHAYSHYINGQRDSGDWRYHSGRWHFMEQAWGLKPRWLFTEAGAYAGVLEGWRHPAVLGGDAGRYVEAVRTWIREVKQTPAYREGRVLGFNLFTTGRSGDTWRYYWTEQPELDALADMIRAEWTPVVAPPPPPPPPEPEPPAVPYVVVVNLLKQTATLAQLQYVAELVYPQRQTVLFSADDAARLVAPGMAGSKVKVWGDWPGIADWLTARGVRIVEQWDFPGDGGWDFPVGTPAERAAATNDWPGDWVDANGYGNLYELSGGTAYHTGADLNLNKPSWDSDRGKPVYAAAAGVVTYARRVPAPSTWGRLVVIRHDGGVYTRYAHMGSMLVTEGQTVTKGQQIGTVGGAEFGLPNHLHFDVSLTERLATAPLDWPGMTWGRVERDYVNPLMFILARKA